MNVLIVHAHPETQSFNATLKNTAMQTLTELGHSVQVSDLYAMNWSPALGAADFDGPRANADYLDLPREQEHAFAQRTHCAAVKAEHSKVAWADLVIFQFPVWWFSMPAILKGWVDRVFSRGFAYSAGRKYESGHFKGKRAMLCITTGTAATLYEPAGIDGDLHHVLWPIHNGILAYTGFTVLPPFAAWAPAGASAQERQSYLQEYAERLRNLDQLEPLYFHPWSDYDKTQRLKPGVPARSGVQWNPRAGQSFEESASSFAATPAKQQKNDTQGNTQGNLFEALHHICIVVKDLDAATTYYESIGIGPWHDFPSLEPFRHELQVPDADAFVASKYRYADLGNVQLQLCAPRPGNTEQRRFLETHGEGVFHLGFSVKDVDAAEAQGQAMGLRTLLHGRKPDRSGFTYFDTREQVGVVLQVRGGPRQPSKERDA